MEESRSSFQKSETVTEYLFDLCREYLICIICICMIRKKKWMGTVLDLPRRHKRTHCKERFTLYIYVHLYKMYTITKKRKSKMAINNKALVKHKKTLYKKSYRQKDILNVHSYKNKCTNLKKNSMIIILCWGTDRIWHFRHNATKWRLFGQQKKERKKENCSHSIP